MSKNNLNNKGNKKIIKKWKLLTKKDVSPSSWFPIEKRKYQLPNNKVVDNFYITTLADVAMIIPITVDKKIVLVKQFKPGINQIMIQFPAGRYEAEHQNLDNTAINELEEETGIKIKLNQLKKIGKLSSFPTKGTEMVHAYAAFNCQFNSHQHLDSTEEIEILTYTAPQLDQAMIQNKILCAQSMAFWWKIKNKYAEQLY